jgi:gamma-carbonic anhydrase
MTDKPNPIILPYRGIMPKIDPKAFIAAGVVIIGDVVIGPQSSIWPGCVLRGDVNVIRIGARTNLQDGSIIHVTYGGQGTHIGDDVTIGHAVLLHDCTIESGAFIGMKSCIMDRAKVAGGAMLAAGALLTNGKQVPKGQLWAGTPAKYWRDLTPEDLKEITERVPHYVKLAESYGDNLLFGSQANDMEKGKYSPSD